MYLTADQQADWSAVLLLLQIPRQYVHLKVLRAWFQEMRFFNAVLRNDFGKLVRNKESTKIQKSPLYFLES